MKTAFFPLSCLSIVFAHSWLECTQYDAQPSNQLYWNASACSGHARCGARQASQGFGVDTGFDFRPLKSGRTCQCSASNAMAYTPSAPMATYKKGQQVCLAYPAKNHVADICTNQYIPDTGVRIYRSENWCDKGNYSDLPLNGWPKEYQHNNGKHIEGHVDYKGFQNCPKFCEDKGRALCTMCFNLEPDLAPGKYSFYWEWSFNSVSDVYTSCWEANVQS